MIAFGILFLILLLIVITLVLRTIGQIGLVKGAWQADEGVKKLRFGELFSGSYPYFWRVVLFTVGLTILGWMIGILLFLPAILFTVLTLGCGLCCLIPFAIIIGWGVSIFINQVIVAIVGENLDVFEGVKRAWQVIRDNFGAYIVMGVILSITTLLITFLLALPLLAMLVPMIIGFIGSAAAESNTGLIAVSTITVTLLCLYIPAMILAGAVMEAYLGTAWTLVFRRLTGRQGEPADASMALPEENEILPEPEPGETGESQQ